MAIKIEKQKTVPAVDMEYIHFDRWTMAISREVGVYRTSMTADVCLYGKMPDGTKVFDADPVRIDIRDLDAFVATLQGQDQIDAMQALGMVQTGLGVLMEKYKGWTFDSVE